MPTTQGIFYDYGAVVLAYMAGQVNVKLYLHLFTDPQTVDLLDFPPGLYSDPIAVGYSPALLSSSQLTMTSPAPPWNAKISGVSWTIGPVSFGSDSIFGWWLEAQTPTVQTTALYGGLFDTPIIIQPTGTLVEFTDLILELHDCGTVPPPPLPTVVWLDPFIDTLGTSLTSHAPIVGAAYTIVQGTWIIGDAETHSSSGANADQVNFNPGSADCTITCTFRATWPNPSNTNRPALFFRYTDPINQWRVIWAPDLTLALVQKVVAGVATNEISGTANDSSPAAAVLEVVCSGSTITLYFNDELVGSVTDSFNHTATEMALFLENSGTGASSSWRNLLVRS